MSAMNEKELNDLLNATSMLIKEETSQDDGGEPQDETCVIEIALDRLSATIMFTKEKNGGKAMTQEEINAKIAAAKITYGIQEDIVNLLALPTKVYNEKIEIARGEEPIKSKDAYIEYTHDVKNGSTTKIKENEDGTVDLFDLGLIQNVSKGELLATLHHAINGQNGMDVYGNEIIVKPGKEMILPVGKGTVLSEDKLQLFADIDGQLINDSGKLTVQNVYEISGDVDTSTGNINFVGSVIIRGSVRAGFSVKAEGNIEVSGVVEAAYIEAGGDVIISGGMQGNKTGKIVAKGNVVAKFFENAIVEAEGDIMSDAIMHSEVKCSGLAIAEGRKGLIVGGSVEAYKGVRAKVIGTHMATPTQINVGVNLQIAEKYKELQDALAQNKKDLTQAEQVKHILESKLKELGALPQDKLEMLQKSYKTIEYLKSVTPMIEQKIEELREVIDHVNRFCIEASDKIYPGVKINIANQKKSITEEIIHSKLSKRDGDIKIDIL